jgi:nicotinamidase-related amidase
MKTALMIVDVQKSLIDEGPFNAEEVLERIARLITLAREASAAVIQPYLEPIPGRSR